MTLAFAYRRWFVTSTIIGATTTEQLRENLGAWERDFSGQAGGSRLELAGAGQRLAVAQEVEGDVLGGGVDDVAGIGGAAPRLGLRTGGGLVERGNAQAEGVVQRREPRRISPTTLQRQHARNVRFRPPLRFAVRCSRLVQSNLPFGKLYFSTRVFFSSSGSEVM